MNGSLAYGINLVIILEVFTTVTCLVTSNLINLNLYSKLALLVSLIELFGMIMIESLINAII